MMLRIVAVLWWAMTLAVSAATLTVGTLSVRTPLDTTIWPRWNGLPVVASAFSNATILHTATVLTPNGAAVTEATVATHRYHLSSDIFRDRRTGFLYVVPNSSGVSEDTGGTQILLSRSEDGGTNWTAAIAIVPSYCAFETGDVPQYTPSGDYMAWNWNWVTNDNRLFYVSSINELAADVVRLQPSLALVAVEISEDGTPGEAFRISTNSFAAIDGKTSPTFSQEIRDLVFETTRYFGFIGGNSVGGTPVTPWVGFIEWGTNVVTECSSATLRGNFQTQLQVGRSFGDSDPRIVARQTSDGGATFSAFKRTDVPSGDLRTLSWKANGRMLPLDDGTFLMSGNFTTNRQDLWIARTDTSMRVQNIQMVWTNIASGSIYAGQGKLGGISYVSLATDGTNVWVGAAMQKTDILVRKILIPPRP